MDNEAQKPQETVGGQTEITNEVVNEATETKSEETSSEATAIISEEKEIATPEELQEEIDLENPEDAEDKDNEKRHHIPLLDYHAMSMENLVGELQRLVKNEKVQAINKHANSIKHEFC